MVVLALCAGCIVSEEMHVDIFIDKDLSGEVTLDVLGIHSDSNDPQERVDELKDYCKEGYLKEGQSLATTFGLNDPQISLTNQTETGCALTVQGRFDNAVRVLSAMAGDGEFEIKKSGGFLVARLLMSRPVQTDDDKSGGGNASTVSIQYAGRIQDHNAHAFDSQSGAMTWFDTRMNETGVQFVLKLPDEDANSGSAATP